MAKFQSKLRTEQDKQTYKLLGDLILDDDVEGTVIAPIGFVTDYASLKALKNILLFVVYALLVTYGNRAAVIHDWVYDQGLIGRKGCDQLFYRALRADGVAKWRALIFYAGVRLGGASAYRDKGGQS